MIDAGSVKRTSAADNPMHFITFRNQEIGKITAVLSRYAGNQGSLHPWRFRFSSQSANGQIIPSGCSRPALLAGRSAAEEDRGATLEARRQSAVATMTATGVAVGRRDRSTSTNRPAPLPRLARAHHVVPGSIARERRGRVRAFRRVVFE